MGMGLDGELQLWATGSALSSATNVSTNTYDQSTPSRHIENSEEIGVAMFISNFVAGTTDTYTLQVISSASANLGTPTVVAQSPAYTAAQITAMLTANGGSGTFFVAISPNTINQQYIGAQLIIAGTPGTITVSGYFMLESDYTQNVPQPANYTL